MGRQIILQPNGKLAVFSSIVDAFIMGDCTEEEIVEDLVEDYRERTTASVKEKVASLRDGGRPYYQFTMSWEEALEQMAAVHGKAKAQEMLDEVDGPAPPHEGG